MKKAFAVMAAILSVLLFISCNNSVTVPETCTVTLKYSDDTTTTDTVLKGGKFTFPSYEKDGKAVTEYRGGEKTYSVGERIEISSDMVFTAELVTPSTPEASVEAYSLVVISNDTVVESKVVRSGEKYTLPDYSAHSGFKGWKVGEETRKSNDVITVTANTAVTALWEAEQVTQYFTVVVISKDLLVDTEYLAENSDYVLPAAPEGTGFNGWKVGEKTELKAAGTTITITGNTTVKADWTVEVAPEKTYYSVVAISKGSVVDSKAVESGTKYKLPAAPDEDGFLGWKVGEDTKPAETEIDITANTTVTALWKAKEYFTVVVISKDSVVANESVEKDTTYTLPSNTETGFTNWKVGSEKKNAGDTIAVSADTTVVAEWTPEPDPVYYSLVVLSKGTVYHSASLLSGATYTLPTLEGTGFKGWRVGTETALRDAGTGIDITADTTVTAEWEAEAAVSYYSVVAVSNGSVVESKAVAAGSEYTLPSSQGTGFKNWKIGDKTYDAGAVITISADTTVAAEWESEAAVEYFAVVVMNGSTIVEAKAVQSGKEYTLPSSSGITGFNGWKVGSEVKNVGEKITITGNTEVTVNLNLCTVTFDGNGGSSTPAISVEGGSNGYAPVSPHRYGYIFTKWTTDQDGKKEFALGTTPITEDMTLYAQWEAFSDPNLNVGDEGPGGGYIFYVNENYAVDGWKYLEITKTSIGSYMFGYYYDGTEFTTVGTSSAVGYGKENTNKLLVMGDSEGKALGSYTVGGSRSDYAAQKCKEYSGGGYSDWFLPSIGELTQLISSTVVTDNKIERYDLQVCMSSSEEDADDAYVVPYMSNEGESAVTPRDDTWTRPVYAVRMF